MKEKSYLDLFLEYRLKSSDGEEIKSALDNTIAEEKQCVELFKFQINHCKQQIGNINNVLNAHGANSDMLVKRSAFEDELLILNVAALAQICNIETKGLQKLLYFEEDEFGKERIAVDANLTMYEWCDDFNDLTGKKFQRLAQKLMSDEDLAAMRKAKKRLCDFFEQERSVLATVRHNVGAHRDHDFMKQQEVLGKIGWADTIERLHRFEEVTLDLGKSLKPFMDAGLAQIANAFGQSSAKQL